MARDAVMAAARAPDPAGARAARSRRAVAASLLLFLLPAAALLPAPAGATILPYSSYGGGWAGGPGDVWLKVAADHEGDTFAVTGGFAASCGTGTIAVERVPASAADQLAVEGVTRSGGTETRWRLTGSIGDFDGAGQLEATVAPRGRRACRVSGRPWSVVSASSEHQGSQEPPAGSRWYGEVASGGVAAFVVGPGGSVVRRAVVTADLGFCPRRPGSEFHATLTALRSEGGGSFRGVRRWTTRSGGVVRRIRVELGGTFYGDGFHGDLTVREVARRASDRRRLWACSTGGLSTYADRYPREPAAQTPASSDS
ncbi:MAG TPA: hypothetical protein VF549_02530 [Solirubrobacteraceae bacterium]